MHMYIYYLNYPSICLDVCMCISIRSRKKGFALESYWLWLFGVTFREELQEDPGSTGKNADEYCLLSWGGWEGQHSCHFVSNPEIVARRWEKISLGRWYSHSHGPCFFPKSLTWLFSHPGCSFTCFRTLKVPFLKFLSKPSSTTVP